MATETQKKSHTHHHKHHHHHQQHAQKKLFHLKSIERITHLPVVEYFHSYYEHLKKSSFLIRLSVLPAETGVWLAVGTAMPVVNLFEKPVSAVDNIVCKGLDVIEANLPVVNYPPEVVYNITKDYVTSNVVNPMLKRADSVKQLSISGASICGELAATRLNNAIDVADKYVEKYLPDIVDGTDPAPEESERANRSTHENQTDAIRNRNFAEKTRWRSINRLHVYSDSHGKQLAAKLKKKLSNTEIFVCVNPGASSSYIVTNAIKGTTTFTKSDFVALITGMDDMIVGGEIEIATKMFLENIEHIVINSQSTNLLVCPVLPQFDLPSNGVINQNIHILNDELQKNLAKRTHVSLINTTMFRRQHFKKSGLLLNKRGKDLLASVIASAVLEFDQRFNDSPSPAPGSDSNTVKTFQHVKQFRNKLQRRLTRRTIAEAKALKQQGADTIRCLVYLVDLLAHDPKAFMEKAKEVWLELSKDEPENQVPPANLEQLIAMLSREMARRVVHLTNYSSTKVLVLTQYGLHTAHIAAYNTIWWADYLLKSLRLDPVVEVALNQISRLHQVSVDLVIRLVEYVRKLKSETVKAVGIPALSLSTQHSPSHTAGASPTSSHSKPSNSQQNGDTCTIPESNHENPEGQEPLMIPPPNSTPTSTPTSSPISTPSSTPNYPATTAARSS
uniref:Lipid storage droplets surface-binding protein 1 n=2 Tax=Graphocephala atropunctata TaxID=36148 RepID=A0A1B6KRN0_9HEMI